MEDLKNEGEIRKQTEGEEKAKNARMCVIFTSKVDQNGPSNL